MGEAPACFAEDLPFSNGFITELKPKTATVVGDKTYVTGGNDDESAFSTEVRIFDRSTSQWISPVVLGTKPDLCKSCTAVLLDSDRILIVRSDSAPDDCFWFLEVDTQFIKEQKKRLETEAVAWSKGIIGEAQKPTVITGPSGVGKGTLISKLMVEFPSMFGFSVSHTTRAPRIKEKNGVHYHFTEKSVMEKEIKEGKFLEFAHVHDNLYGTSIEAVEVVADAGKRCILDIDVQGASFVRASSVEAVFIFIKPPSFDELEKRLRSRGTETEQQIQKRLQNARSELEQGESSGIFDHILINDDLDSCYMNLKEVLGLDGIPSTALESSVETGLLSNPVNLLGSKLGGKILVTCGSRDLEVRSKKFVLDVSCIKGGAPGRTRGIKVYPADSSPNGFNGMTEPS